MRTFAAFLIPTGRDDLKQSDFSDSPFFLKLQSSDLSQRGERYHESTSLLRVEKTYLSTYPRCSSDPGGISSNLVVFFCLFITP
jgi:hypothetical protein